MLQFFTRVIRGGIIFYFQEQLDDDKYQYEKNSYILIDDPKDFIWD